MLGEIHNNKQEYEWLRSLVSNPEFADRVDDVVMELGNSLYQKSVDRYIAGEAVPIEEVQRAWRNTLGLAVRGGSISILRRERDSKLCRQDENAFERIFLCAPRQNLRPQA